MNRKSRNIFAVRSALQLKYVLLLLFSMLMPSMFVGICMYYLIFIIVTGDVSVSEPIAYNLFPALYKVNLIMSVGLFVIFVVFLMAVFYISSKLMGPLERLRKDLKQIAEGDLTHRIKMRKNDDLLFIRDLVNQILDRMCKKR